MVKFELLDPAAKIDKYTMQYVLRALSDQKSKFQYRSHVSRMLIHVVSLMTARLVYEYNPSQEREIAE